MECCFCGVYRFISLALTHSHTNFSYFKIQIHFSKLPLLLVPLLSFTLQFRPSDIQHSISFVRKLPWPAGRESSNSHYQTELSAVTETRRTINNYSFKVFPKGTAMLLNNAYESDSALCI